MILKDLSMNSGMYPNTDPTTNITDNTPVNTSVKPRGRGRPLWFWPATVVGALVLMAFAVLAGYQLHLFERGRNPNQVNGSLTVAQATATAEGVPTFTVTPDGEPGVQLVAPPTEVEATPADLVQQAAVESAPGEPTGVPPLEAQQPVVPAERTITLDDIAPSADQSPPPTPAPPTPTPTARSSRPTCWSRRR